MDERFKLEIDVVEKMDTFFKMDQFEETLKLFQAVWSKWMEDLWISYSFVIYRMYIRDKASKAKNLTLGSLAC